MSIKFTDLSSATTLQPNDLFAVTVDADNTSQNVSFATLQNQILDEATVRNARSNIVQILNENNQTLNADLLDGQHGSYYLDYTNLENKADIPQDLHDLDNRFVEDNQGTIGGFIRVRGTDNKLVFQPKQDGQTFTPAIITTTNLDEGSNLYFTDDRVESYFDQNFARFFNKFNVTFDQGNVLDSYFDTVGFAPSVTVSGETSKLRVKIEGNIPGVSSDYEKREQGNRFNSYPPGTNIRVFGADTAETADPMINNLIFNDSSIDVVGFRVWDDNNFAGGTPKFNALTGVEADPVTQSDTITTNSPHGFAAGQAVIYNSGGSGAIFGLQDGTTYYVRNPNGNDLQLMANPNDIGPINIDKGSGENHTLTPTTVTTPFQRITYSLCEWDMTTGKISPPTQEVSVNLGIPVNPEVADPDNYLADNPDRILEDFSVENFVKLKLLYNNQGATQAGVTPGRAICVYRRVSQINTIEEQLKGVPKLVGVLGPLELRNNYWIDYYTDDVLTHSNKNQEDNSYIPEKTVHFKPFELPNATQGSRGWADTTIVSVDYENPVNPQLSTYIDLNLSTNLIMEPGETNGAWISHNDTSLIQSAIDTNSGSGRKAIQFNPKDYIVESITIPPNFSVAGYSYNTKLIKLPWSGWRGSTASSDSTIIKGRPGRLSNASFVGFDVDGNSINSIGFDDSTDRTKNFAINFGNFCNSILLDKVRLSKPIGGGVFAPDPKNLKIVACELLDSGITDRHVFQPLVADGGENTSISSNRFENFSKGSADISITNKGAIEGNIVANCGSGLLVFGSKFMITSPNVLTGPAGEFLPQPDAYNSEYDLINIDLTESTLHVDGPQQFDSGSLKYQENGEVYDLGGAPHYKIFAIKKDSTTGDESIWIDDLRPPTGKSALKHTVTFNPGGSNVIDTNNDIIDFGAIEHTLEDGDIVYYDSGPGAVPPSENLISGNAYFVHKHSNTEIMLFTNYTSAIAGTGIGKIDFTTSSLGNSTGSQHTLTRNAFLDMQPGALADNTPDQGGFQFTIPGDTVGKIKLSGQPYTVESMRDPTKTVYHRNTAGDLVQTPGDPDHIGLGWSASITQYVDAAMIINTPGIPGVWTEEGGEVYYEIAVRDYKYLSRGVKVRPRALGEDGSLVHQNFSPGAGADDFGVIDDLGSGTDEIQVKIKWSNANFADVSAGSGGILQVEDTFVIATGRIK